MYEHSENEISNRDKSPRLVFLQIVSNIKYSSSPHTKRQVAIPILPFIIPNKSTPR